MDLLMVGLLIQLEGKGWGEEAGKGGPVNLASCEYNFIIVHKNLV